MDVVFRALGPVGVECGGTALTLRPMEQALLAVLLARSRHWASTDELVDALWPDHPARNATNSLRVQAHRLRTQFREAGRHRLVTEAAGYRLVVEPGELDLAVFESAERRALDAWPRSRADGIRILRDALALWRGRPFADINAPFARDAADRLSVVREGILTTLADFELAVGNHRPLRAEIDQWAHEFPWSEELARAQVLTHYRCGDVEGASRRHGAFTRRLRGELGVEASADFRKLLVDILNQDPGLNPVETYAVDAPAVHQRLPHGRSPQAAAIEAALRSRGGVVAIVAPGGFGKTTLIRALAEANSRWSIVRQTSVVAWFERVLDGEPEVSSAPVEGQSVHLRLANAVLRACQARGVEVLAIDDADLMAADAESVLAALAGMPRRPGIVITSRSHAGLDSLVGRGVDLADVIVLPELGEDEARAVVLDVVPAAADAATVDAIVASAEGHPLLLSALSRHVAAGGDVADVPVTVTAYVRALLQSLPDPQRRLAVLAALDPPTDLDIGALAALSARPTEDVLGDLEGMMAAGLLADGPGGLTFRHKAFRDATRESVSKARQRSLHFSFAALLLADTAPGAGLGRVQRLTRHLIEAQEASQGAYTAQWLAAEAALLRRHARVLDAADRFDLASTYGTRHGIEDRAILQWRMAAGEARSSAGRVSEAMAAARELAPAARELGPGPLSRLAVHAVGPWFPNGRTDAWIEPLLLEALTGLGAGDRGPRAQALEALTRVRYTTTWNGAGPARPEALADLAEVAADESMDLRTRAIAVKGMHTLTLSEPDWAGRAVALSASLVALTAAHEDQDHLEALRIHVRSLMDAGAVNDVRFWSGDYLMAAERAGSDLHLWWAAMLGRSVASHVGDGASAAHLEARARECAASVDAALRDQCAMERHLAVLLRDGHPVTSAAAEQLAAFADLADPVVAAAVIALKARAGAVVDDDVRALWPSAPTGRRGAQFAMLVGFAVPCVVDPGLRLSLGAQVRRLVAPVGAGLATVTGAEILGTYADLVATWDTPAHH